MSDLMYALFECLATYCLWALAIGSGMRLFRETRGERGITPWARVLGTVCLLSVITAFVWTVLICEAHIA